jgi:hypothetical protein
MGRAERLRKADSRRRRRVTTGASIAVGTRESLGQSPTRLLFVAETTRVTGHAVPDRVAFPGCEDLSPSTSLSSR